MQIRSIDIEDIEVIVELWRACNLTRPWNNPYKDVDIALKTDSCNILVGYDDDELVATVMCGFDGHRGWLYYLAVAPNRQGCGFGRKITNAAEEWLAIAGAPKVELMIRDDNVAVREFYENLGFAVEPRVVMAKWLSKPPAPQQED